MSPGALVLETKASDRVGWMHDRCEIEIIEKRRRKATSCVDAISLKKTYQTKVSYGAMWLQMPCLSSRGLDDRDDE